MLFLDGSNFAVINSLLVVMFPALLDSCSVQGLHAVFRGRKYRSHLLPFSHLIAAKECSKGNLRRRILQMG
jgi:hypothetical protein